MTNSHLPIVGNSGGLGSTPSSKPLRSPLNLSTVRAMNRRPSRLAMAHNAELIAAHWAEVEVARAMRRWAIGFPAETWLALRRKAVV
jgi:hypothetical protein